MQCLRQVSCLGLCLLLVAFSSSCSVLKNASNAPGAAARAMSPDNKEAGAVTPVIVQQALLRFSDEFATRMVLDLEKLKRGTNALAPAEVLRWKINLTSQIFSIASGPNPITGLLDMTAFVTVIRESVEEQRAVQAFGESAQPMLDNCREAEKKIWGVAGKVINPEQQQELRAAIEAWRRQNPQPDSVLAARALGLSSLAEAVKADPSARGSVFSVLRLDPLAGLDPATREIELTRLFAERGLHVAQWMPTLLRWQIELTSLNTAAIPEVQQLVTNSTRMSASVERFTAAAEKLPGQISAERAAIVKDLQTQEQQLTPLVDQVRQTLTVGTQMSTSLNTTIVTFDGLMKRFGIGETKSADPSDATAPPFQILEYAQTATNLESMARQLTELVRSLDQTLGDTNVARLSAQVSPVVQQAQAGSREIVDYAFWKGILAMGIALVLALIYRFLGPRLTPATRSTSNSL